MEDEECGCGPSSECETCKGPACSCLGDWSDWGPCDGPCGGGVKTRERNDPCIPDFEPEVETMECEEIRESQTGSPKILNRDQTRNRINSILDKYI